MNKKKLGMNTVVILGMFFSYFIIDFFIRYISYRSYGYYSYLKLSPNLFSIGYISLFIGVYYLINRKWRRVYYLINLFIFNLLVYSQYLHFLILKRFFGTDDLILAREGSSYFNYALGNTDFKIIVVMIISLLLGIVVSIFGKKYYEETRDKAYFLFITLVLFFGCYMTSYFKLGKEIDKNDEALDYTYSMSYIDSYNEFNNTNKNMQLSGLYNDVFREIFVYFYKKINATDTSKYSKEIKKYLKENKSSAKEKNDYTGIFAGKNVIVILMESIDKSLVTEEVMPCLYNLEKKGINFVNRYSPSFGGGETINSEFAINTGLYSKIGIYNYANTYRTSLANSFKKKGYSVNSIHYNNGYYYNRSQFHINLGYDKHYALKDMKNIEAKKYDYQWDSNLIKSDKVYDLIVRDNKFLTFITTYSAHLPYSSSQNERCRANKYKLTGSSTELSCLKNLARDTDEMLKQLISRLESDGKLEDTVLVLASDHYSYGYDYVKEDRGISNEYLLQNTPFVIYSSGIEHKDVFEYVDTADILPTLLNMFGIDYDSEYYVGEDVFRKDRDDYVYFSEDVYFDGKLHYKGKGGDAKIYNDIKEKIRYNNNLIESNYLRVSK